MVPDIAIIVPCLNEECVLRHTIGTLSLLLERMESLGEAGAGSFLLLVDDGSTDATWNIIRKEACAKIRGIRLSRRCGQQAALLAGLEAAADDCDACITIDADLQDDPEAIPRMVAEYRQGAEIVFGIRRNRNSDSWIKKTSASLFYSALGSLGVETKGNHADFRLMGKRAVKDLLEYGECNLFLRALVPQLGYTQATVEYDRLPRCGGHSKYPLRKMFDLAADGITSFSVRPVRMLFWLGVLFILTDLGMAVYVLTRHFSGATIEGWTSLMLSIWFCTGVLLIGLGIVGEYIGRIYIEVKHRPRWKVADKV